MEERLYSLNDANFNTTALVTSGGVVAERFLYDPYGQVTAANGTPAPPSADNAWIYLHQVGRWESSTGMYNFRNRDFSPTLMRWTTNDPIGFGGGDTNTYRYVGNGPGNRVDPSGLFFMALLDFEWGIFGSLALQSAIFIGILPFFLNQKTCSGFMMHQIKNLRCVYRFPGFEPRSALRPHPQVASAIVITLRRRKKGPVRRLRYYPKLPL